MKTPLLAGASIALFVLVLGAGRGLGEDEAAAPQPMSEVEMWAKTAALAQPSKMHTEVLSRFVGTWDTRGKAFSGMGEMPIEGRGVHTSVLGGRFVHIAYAGPFMGQPFEGAAFLGYDNLGQRFQQTWIMSMATSMDHMTGTWDAETNTLTWRGRVNMCDGSVYDKRTTMRFEGDDRIVSESFATGPDGREQKEMEMVYTRVN